jgi:cobalt/nickel transport system permease protein
VAAVTDLRRKAGELYSLEGLSSREGIIHRLHPGVKILGTVVFMVMVISFDRYSLSRLLPFLLYPSILIALADLPLALLLRRCAVALPFCLFAGISNLFLERETAFRLGPLSVSLGFISLCTLLLRTLLCVAAVLILIATTPWARLSAQLRRFRVPAIFVTLLEISYRYITVLLEEAGNMYTAYRLRGNGARGIALCHAGSFAGSLFLRCADRAERIYAAMKCRGYSPEAVPSFPHPLARGDVLFFTLVSLGCLLFRFQDIPALAGRLIGRVLSL